MHGFIFLIVAMRLILVLEIAFALTGFVNLRAENPPSRLENAVVGYAMDANVAPEAPKLWTVRPWPPESDCNMTRSPTNQRPNLTNWAFYSSLLLQRRDRLMAELLVFRHPENADIISSLLPDQNVSSDRKWLSPDIQTAPRVEQVNAPARRVIRK